ncbi:cyclin D1 binding protein 1 [Rhinolophus ferrumequinum]|uniref:Cyclin D1 binding protein 1 n=1 Tax=Rhinolophus ferrumequinum TaxID=59479 RepID=A0A7J7XMS7_RHIFE|nr:cyclin D1 binding protein 1 [Rhinolophus ferrumequinum]
MAGAGAPAAAISTLTPPLEQLRLLAGELRLLLPGVRVGEARETTKEFNRKTFWRRLSECLSCLLPASQPLPPPLSPPPPAASSLRGYLTIYPQRLKYKTLIFGGVFSTSKGVERTRYL